MSADAMEFYAERCPEWQVTILFYSALHYVDAFLATQGTHPKSHHERFGLVSNLTDVARYYETLFKRSMNARYHLYEFTPQEVDRIKAGAFRRVKEGILALLTGQA